MPPHTLIAIRHAPTAAPDGQIAGHHDVPLSDDGQRAAEAFARSFAASWDGSPVERIVASDLSRAQHTAQPLADALGLAVASDARLREVDFGAWEGRTWEAVEASDPDAMSDWMTDWVETPPPGGESFRDLSERVANWLAETPLGEQDDESTTVVVAHAGSIRALLCHTLDLPLASAFNFAVDPLHAVHLRRSAPSCWQLTRLTPAQVNLNPAG